MKIGLNEIKQKELELTEKHKDNRSELFDILAKFQINR